MHHTRCIPTRLCSLSSAPHGHILQGNASSGTRPKPEGQRDSAEVATHPLCPTAPCKVASCTCSKCLHHLLIGRASWGICLMAQPVDINQVGSKVLQVPGNGTLSTSCASSQTNHIWARREVQVFLRKEKKSQRLWWGQERLGRGEGLHVNPVQALEMAGPVGRSSMKHDHRHGINLAQGLSFCPTRG